MQPLACRDGSIDRLWDAKSRCVMTGHDGALGRRVPAGRLDGAEVAQHVGGAVFGFQEAVTLIGMNQFSNAVLR